MDVLNYEDLNFQFSSSRMLCFCTTTSSNQGGGFLVEILVEVFGGLLVSNKQSCLIVMTFCWFMRSQTHCGLVHLSPLGCLIKQSHFLDTWPNMDLTRYTIQLLCEKHHWVYLIGAPMTTQLHQKQHMIISSRLFLLKSGTLSISQGRNHITSTSRIFSNTNVNCTWSNHWHCHNARSSLPTTPRIIDLPLKLDDDQLSLSLEILDYATFCSYNAVENKAHLCWNVPCIIP